MAASEPSETIVILTIKHRKPLPSKVPITDVISERLYMFLYAQGVEADVRASLCPKKKEAWEKTDAPV